MCNYKEKHMKLKIMREVQNSSERWNTKKSIQLLLSTLLDYI